VGDWGGAEGRGTRREGGGIRSGGGVIWFEKIKGWIGITR
jgi:hypothetical protein